MPLPLSPTLLEVRVKGDPTLAVVVPTDLNHTNVDALGQQLYALVGPRRLHLDLANVESLDGVALGKLVGLYKRLRDAGGHLALLNVCDLVYEVLQVTRLDRLLDVRKGGGPDTSVA